MAKWIPPVDPGPSLADDIEKIPHALRAADLAKLLSVSKMTIYRMVEESTIPFFRVGGSIRFDPKGIAAWLRRRLPPKGFP